MAHYDPALVKAALVQIAPASERTAECKDAIKLKIATLRVARQIQRIEQSARIQRTALEKSEKALQAIETAAKDLPISFISDPKFLNRVKKSAQVSRRYSALFRAGPGLNRLPI